MPLETWKEKLYKRCQAPFSKAGAFWAHGYACALSDAGHITTFDLTVFLEYVDANTDEE